MSNLYALPSKLPMKNRKKNVQDMAIGDVAYIADYKLHVDSEWYVWVSVDCPIRRFGNNENPEVLGYLEIKRTDEGIKVWLDTNCCWSKNTSLDVSRSELFLPVEIAEY